MTLPIRGPAEGLTARLVGLRVHLHLLRHHERRVEAHSKLTDDAAPNISGLLGNGFQEFLQQQVIINFTINVSSVFWHPLYEWLVLPIGRYVIPTK